MDNPRQHSLVTLHPGLPTPLFLPKKGVLFLQKKKLGGEGLGARLKISRMCPR